MALLQGLPHNALLLATNDRISLYSLRKQFLQLILFASISEAIEPPYDEGLHTTGRQVARCP